MNNRNNMRPMLLLLLGCIAVGCGPELDKETRSNNPGQTSSTNNESTNNTSTNNQTNNTSTNNTSTNTQTNNASTNTQTNNASTNNQTNNTSTNNTSTNNTSTNNANNTTATNNQQDQQIVFVPGELGSFDESLDDAGIDYTVVGGDGPQTVVDLEQFLTGDLSGVSTIIVDAGRHGSQLEDMNINTNAVSEGVRDFVRGGGRFVDLSGGLSARAFMNFAGITGFVTPGTYSARALDLDLPRPTFEFTAAPQNGNGFSNMMTFSLDGSDTVLVEADVMLCDLFDFSCSNPVASTEPVIVLREVDAGLLFLSTLRSPLTAGATETVLALLTY